jgi:hypothetical protein
LGWRIGLRVIHLDETGLGVVRENGANTSPIFSSYRWIGSIGIGSSRSGFERDQFNRDRFEQVWIRAGSGLSGINSVGLRSLIKPGSRLEITLIEITLIEITLIVEISNLQILFCRPGIANKTLYIDILQNISCDSAKNTKLKILFAKKGNSRQQTRRITVFTIPAIA